MTRKKYILIRVKDDRVLLRSNNFKDIKKALKIVMGFFIIEAWTSETTKKTICKGANGKEFITFKGYPKR